MTVPTMLPGRAVGLRTEEPGHGHGEGHDDLTWVSTSGPLPTYEQMLIEEAQVNPDLLVLTAENRAAIRGLPQKLPERFIDVGIAEQTMIGMAAGLALRGRVPVCHALATFLTLRAFEFIRTDVGIAGLPVKLVGAVPGFLSDGNGPTHQAIEDLALMRGIPGMEIFCPADAWELVQAMPQLIRRPAPLYVRYNAQPAVLPRHAPFVPGKAEIIETERPERVHSEIAILTHGFLLREVLVARDLLEDDGHTVQIVNLRMLRPLDTEAIVNATRASLVVTVEDHFETNGLPSLVAEVLFKRGILARLLPIGLPERWFKPGRLGDVLAYEGFNGEALARTILTNL